MPQIKLFYIFLTAVMASLLIMPSLYDLSQRIGCIDVPDNGRKIHEKEIPRIGGIAILCGLLIAVLIFCTANRFLSGLIAGAAIIFFIGFIDDIRHLSALQKMAGQILGASVGVILGENHIQSLGNLFLTGNIELSIYIGIPFTVFCIVGLINSLNMIDGLDGLASGVSAIACMAFAVIALRTGNTQALFVAVALLGAITGFMFYNVHPARIFMGDAGSNLLGFTLGMVAVALLNGPQTVSPVAVLIILAVPVFDTFIVMARRFLRGRPIMGADRSHIHHRLLDMGLGHKISVLVVYACSYFMAAIGVTAYSTHDSLLLLILIVGTFLHYLTLFMTYKFLAPRYAILTNDLPLIRPEVHEQLSQRLLPIAKYMLVTILVATQLINLPHDFYQASITGFLFLFLVITYLFRSTWSSQLLQICLYTTGAFLVFQEENYSHNASLTSIPISRLSLFLFAALLMILLPKIIIRRRYNILMNSAFEYLLFLLAVFIPLLPDDLITRYHLLNVAGKSIILFIAYKLILVRDDIKLNRTIIFASMLALLACMINRLI